MLSSTFDPKEKMGPDNSLEMSASEKLTVYYLLDSLTKDYNVILQVNKTAHFTYFRSDIFLKICQFISIMFIFIFSYLTNISNFNFPLGSNLEFRHC